MNRNFTPAGRAMLCLLFVVSSLSAAAGFSPPLDCSPISLERGQHWVSIEAESYCNAFGVTRGSDAGPTGSGGYVSFDEAGDYVEFPIDASVRYKYTLKIWARDKSGGRIIVSAKGRYLDRTQAYGQDWSISAVDFTLDYGSQALRIANDGDGDWDLDRIEFIPTIDYSHIPSAYAGPDLSTTLPATSQALLGAGGDPDATHDDGLTYQWTQVSGPSAAGIFEADTSIAFVGVLVPGTYVFRLTVTKQSGDRTTRDADEMTLTVNPPPASAGALAPGRIEAEAYSNMSGIQTESTSDAGGGLNVGYIDPGDWMEYKVVPSLTGVYTIHFRVASTSASNTKFEVRNSNGTLLTTVSVPNTGAWQSWTHVHAEVILPAGSQTLRLTSTGTGYWNINYMEFSRAGDYPMPLSVGIPVRSNATAYRNMGGVMPERSTDPQDVPGEVRRDYNVGYIDFGDWMEYYVSMPGASDVRVNFRVSTPSINNPQFELRDANNKVLATVNVPNTGGWYNWTTISTTISLPAGNHAIRLYSTGGGYWNLRWLEFMNMTGTPYAAAPAKKETEGASADGPALVLFPNPVYDQLSLQVNNEYTGDLRIQVMSSNGAAVRQLRAVKGVKGRQVIPVNVSGLTPGSYMIIVTMKDWRGSVMMMKR